jgi:hypothetical protein
MLGGACGAVPDELQQHSGCDQVQVVQALQYQHLQHDRTIGHMSSSAGKWDHQSHAALHPLIVEPVEPLNHMQTSDMPGIQADT